MGIVLGHLDAGGESAATSQMESDFRVTCSRVLRRGREVTLARRSRKRWECDVIVAMGRCSWVKWLDEGRI